MTLAWPLPSSRLQAPFGQISPCSPVHLQPQPGVWQTAGSQQVSPERLLLMKRLGVPVYVCTSTLCLGRQESIHRSVSDTARRGEAPTLVQPRGSTHACEGPASVVFWKQLTPAHKHSCDIIIYACLSSSSFSDIKLVA